MECTHIQSLVDIEHAADMDVSSPVSSSSVSVKRKDSADDHVFDARQKEASLDEDRSAVLDEPPNGGLMAWLQVLGAFMLFFNNWGLFAAFGAFQTFYEIDLLSSYSASDITWIGTFQAALMICVGVLSGPYCDRGYIRAIVVLATFCIVFGHMMLSLVQPGKYYQIILSQSVVAGFGMGLIYVPAVAIVSTWFTTKRPLALGVTGSGTAVGGVLYPVIFRRLQPRIGFPWATRVMGFVALATLVIPIVLLRHYKRPSKPRQLLDMTAFRDVPFLLCTLSGVIIFAGLFVPYYFIPTYAYLTSTITPDLAFYLLCVLNAGSFFGRLMLGVMAMRVGAFRTYHITATICMILIFVWIGIHSLAGTIAFSVLYGFFSGGLVVLIGAVMPLISPSMDLIGTRFGMCSMPSGIGLLIGAPIASALSNVEQGHFLGMQIWAGCSVALAVIVLIGPHMMLGKIHNWKPM